MEHLKRTEATSRGRTALLIIDAQVNMFDEKLGLYRSQEILKIILELLSKARAAGTPVFYLQNEGGPGDPDRRGTEGWKIYPPILPQEGDVVIPKSSPNGFTATALENELDRLGVKRLVVVGMQSEFCVDATCRGAHERGFEVTLVEDGHTTFDGKSKTASEIVESINGGLRGIANLTSAADIEFTAT